MIIGEVSADKEIVFSLPVRDSRGRDHLTRVVLDTGFGGHLILPAEMIAGLELVYIDEVEIWAVGDAPQTVRQFECVIT